MATQYILRHSRKTEAPPYQTIVKLVPGNDTDTQSKASSYLLLESSRMRAKESVAVADKQLEESVSRTSGTGEASY